MRTEVKIFVSYSHNNQELANRFLNKFKQYTLPSKKYHYLFWQDTKLLAGEQWDQEIKKALDECQLGLLLISSSFLGSKYITEVELQLLKNKPIIPVLLWPIDFDRHDLRGLNKHQIFRLENPGMIRPKSYGECTTRQREYFALALFQHVEKRLDKLLKL